MATKKKSAKKKMGRPKVPFPFVKVSARLHPKTMALLEEEVAIKRQEEDNPDFSSSMFIRWLCEQYFGDPA